MEKEKEIERLVRMLRRIANPGRFAMWREPAPDWTEFCRNQYNRVLSRLMELEPEASALFAPVDVDASSTVVRMAAEDLASFFASEAEPVSERRHRNRCRPRHAFVGAIHVGGRSC